MLGITDLGTYIIGAAAVILLPGPNSLFCLSTAGQYGAKAAYRSVAGIFIGDSILMLLTALGAASVLHTVPTLFWILKTLGGLYLAYIGFNLLRGAVKKWSAHRPTADTAQAENRSIKPVPAGIFRRALMLSLSNPKAILFFLSFFVQFVDPDYAHPALSFLLLAVILQIFSMLYLSMLIFSGISLVRWFGRYRKAAAGGMGAVGLMFMGFAAKLWTATAR